MSTHIDERRLSTDSKRSHTLRTKESPTPLCDVACACTAESREGAELKRIREECFSCHVSYILQLGGGTVASTVYRIAPSSRCTRPCACSFPRLARTRNINGGLQGQLEIENELEWSFLAVVASWSTIAGCLVCCVVCRSWTALGRAHRALCTWWSAGREGGSMCSNR